MKNLDKFRVVSEREQAFLLVSKENVSEIGKRLGVPAVLVDVGNLEIFEPTEIDMILKGGYWDTVEESKDEGIKSLINRHFSDKDIDDLIVKKLTI